MLRLVVKDSAGNLYEYPLDFEELIIGREEGCGVILDAPDVSRRHCRFFFDQEGYLLVEDAGSAGGTIVDGQAITTPAAIDENSKVLIGSFILFLQDVPDEDLDGEAPTGPIDDFPEVDGARLLVLDGPDRGAEYPLTGSEITIGRAGANLIVLDQPSISPEHAQILLEGDAYLLQDLASVKGTRVNGKEIDEVALRDGDVVQLGSLRFRFVYGREVTRRRSVAKLAQELKARWKILAPLAGVVLLLIVLLAAVGGGGDTGPGAGPGGAEAAPTAQARLLQARTAMEQGQWDAAGTTLEQILAADPLNDKARELTAQIAKEQEIKRAYDEATMLFDLGRQEEAKQALVKIPTESYYYQLAKPKLQELNEHLAKQYFDMGQRAYKRERYKKAHDILTKYLDVHPEDAKVKRWVRDCEKKLERQKVSFQRWESPYSSSAPAARLVLSHVPAVLGEDVRRYHQGEIDAALKHLERLIARQKVKGAEREAAARIRQLMLLVRGKFTSGQSAFFRRDLETAKAEWDEALRADGQLVPGSSESYVAREIANNLARGYVERAQDALAKELFERAYEDYALALTARADDVMARRGLLKLERVARRLLAEAQVKQDEGLRHQAARAARRAAAITRQDSEVHQQAQEMLEK